MDKQIVVNLSGHPEQYRLDEQAYDKLSRYLDGAGTRLYDDPDRAEVLGDLERSIGDKLTALLAAEDRLLTAADIDGVLAEIGTVDTGSEPRAAAEAPAPPRKRRLVRIREGQMLAGVCTGLATYAELDVAWVRTGFVLATVVTAGFFLVVYIAMAFILPITATAEG